MMQKDNQIQESNEDMVKDPVEQSETDKQDAEESHSTAADGGNDNVEPENEDTEFESQSEGNLPDPETIAANEDGENDKEKISDK